MSIRQYFCVSSNCSQTAALTSVLIITALVYVPGLQGGFLFDDFHNIVRNPSLYLNQLTWPDIKNAALSSNAGLLKRPLAMLSFALNGYFGGLDAGSLKATNLIIHLFNGIAVYYLARVTFSLKTSDPADAHAPHPWWPILISLLWLSAPVNLSSVLYVVQRMTSLAAFFTFTGLTVYVNLRRGHLAGKYSGWTVALALLIFTVLAALCKENGILLPALALCYELTILRFESFREDGAKKVFIVYATIGTVACWLFLMLMLMKPDILLGGYLIRDFTLTERLLTETRVLWLYLTLTFLPLPSTLGLYHDDITISHNLTSPFTTLPALLGLIGLFLTAWWLRKKQPITSLGILLFFAGHALESSVFPLEIAHEHRNYFPSFGLFLSLAAITREFLETRGYIVLSALGIVFLISTGVRVLLWASPIELVLMGARHHPASARSNYEAGWIYSRLMNNSELPNKKKEYYQKARYYFLNSSNVETSFISGLLSVIAIDDTFGAGNDDKVIQQAKYRLSHEKISVTTKSILSRYHECEISKQCNFPGEILYDFYLAIIRNPNIAPDMLDGLMSEATTRALQLNRFDEALAIAHDAAKQSPLQPQLGINYAILLMSAHRYQAAQMELDRVAALDCDARIHDQLQKQRAVLQELQRNPRAP